MCLGASPKGRQARRPGLFRLTFQKAYEAGKKRTSEIRERNGSASQCVDPWQPATLQSLSFLHQVRACESSVAQSCPTLWDPVDCSPPGSSLHGIFQAGILEWGCRSLLQGIFPAQKLNLSLPHCQVDSLPWCHLGSPFFMTVCSKLPMGSFGGTRWGQGTAEGIQGQIVRAAGWLLEKMQRQSELPLRELKASVRSTDFRSPAHRCTFHSQASVYLLFTFFVCFRPHAIQLVGALVPWSRDYTCAPSIGSPEC